MVVCSDDCGSLDECGSLVCLSLVVRLGMDSPVHR